jgi:hypothetical protein
VLETIPLDHPLLRRGWWDVECPAEGAGDQMWRWTQGEATLPLDSAEPVILEVHVAHTLTYPFATPPPVAKREPGTLAA